MSDILNVGILGVDGIGKAMGRTLAGMKEARLYAVASRSIERARRFAQDWAAEKVFGDYDSLIADPKVDLVHLAVPHAFHFDLMMRCIKAGKNVLSEKAFTLNREQAERAINLAREKKVFVAEATWTRYQPSRFMIDDFLKSGSLGAPRSIIAGFSFALSNIERIYSPELGGGALLDMGVYPLNFAMSVFGDDVKDVHSVMSPLKSGVDGTDSITLTFAGGEKAVLIASVEAVGDNRAVIQCEKGSITVNPLVNIREIVLRDKEGRISGDYYAPTRGTGYEYEVLSCKKAIEEGKLEPPEHTHEHILKQMEILDSLRSSWGFKYPGE